jgi:hypothetical protein
MMHQKGVAKIVFVTIGGFFVEEARDAGMKSISKMLSRPKTRQLCGRGATEPIANFEFRTREHRVPTLRHPNHEHVASGTRSLL